MSRSARPRFGLRFRRTGPCDWRCGRPTADAPRRALRPCGESRERPRLVAESPDGGSRARTTSSQGQRPAPRWRGDGQRTPPVGRDGLGRVSGWALLPRRPARGREREKLLLPVPVCAPGCVRPAPRTSAGTGPSLAPLRRTPAWELRSQARRDTSGALAAVAVASPHKQLRVGPRGRMELRRTLSSSEPGAATYSRSTCSFAISLSRSFLTMFSTLFLLAMRLTSRRVPTRFPVCGVVSGIAVFEAGPRDCACGRLSRPSGRRRRAGEGLLVLRGAMKRWPPGPRWPEQQARLPAGQLSPG